jgi:ADP-heptose:LPS heptosyltransferase
MKILIGMHGQYGDQFIQLPFIEYIRKQYPDAEIVKLVNKKYEGVIPILAMCPYIDNFFISDEYENFSEETDLDSQNFDIIFPAMPKHSDPSWFLKRHQTTEVFDMFGYKSPEEKYQINIPKPPPVVSDGEWWISFAPFAGFYNSNNNKKLSIEKAQEIVNALAQTGYKILQIGGPDEPKLKNTLRMENLLYGQSFSLIATTKLFIHCDTGLGWAASGIQHTCLGLYSNEGYGDRIKNIQPVNPHSFYLDAKTVNEIPNELILQKANEAFYVNPGAPQMLK